jgi:hypothetical protein
VEPVWPRVAPAVAEPRDVEEAEALAVPPMVAAVEPQAAVAAQEEPWVAVEVAPGAAPLVVAAVEPQAAAAEWAEPWAAGVAQPRDGARAEEAVVAEPQAEAAAEAEQRAGGLPRPAAAPGPGVQPPGVQSWVEACRSIRRICSPAEKICSTSGTSPGERPTPPECAQLKGAGGRARGGLLCVGAFHNARSWARTSGSCFRRTRSACSVLFLVRLRQRSYSMLISIGVGVTRRWL